MSGHHAGTFARPSKQWTCKRCGCAENRACRVEITVTHPNGARTTLLEDECGRSAAGLCSACDERLLPELKSLIDVWRQLGVIAGMYGTLH